MPKIQTLGSIRRRTWFEYRGAVIDSTTMEFSGKPFISPEFYRTALSHFSGTTTKGGFSMSSPSSGGFGEWISENSLKSGRKLTPRHGSFISAILIREGYISARDLTISFVS